MPDIVNEPWFGWAVVVAVGLPLLLVILTELHSALERRGNSMSPTVRLLRNYVVPLAGLYVVLKKVSPASPGNDWVRITATVLGFLILIAVLSTLNSALFLHAAQGTWRQRLPSIFIDIARVIIIGVGLALLFSWVWGADISGLFAALGVTTLVLGFALQNAVGSIISGLLLLFEQPFRLGDWLQTGAGSGRIVEVNWRAMHIDNGNGVVIIPNATLADGAFTNLSRPTNSYTETIQSTFSVNDPPLSVMTMLTEVAAALPLLEQGKSPSTVMTGAGAFATSVPLATYAHAGATSNEFRLRAWYASRRANLTMDGADIWQGEATSDVAAVLPRFASSLRLAAAQIPEYAPQVDLQRYASGETILAQGRVPAAVSYLVAGRVALTHRAPDGSTVSLLSLQPGDCVGQTSLTREPTALRAVAVSETTLLVIPQGVIDSLVRNNPDLARDIGKQIDQRRTQIMKAMAELEQTQTQAPTQPAAQRSRRPV